MDDRGWIERFLDSTRGRIVRLLRRQGHSVSELARELEVTDAAVRNQLSLLERDGLVRQAGQRPGVRKPIAYYALTDEAERLFPKPYSQLLSELLAVLDGQMPAEAVDRVLEETGRRIGRRVAPPPGTDDEARLRLAGELVAELGGLAEVREEDGVRVIQGFSCPVRDVACRDGRVCSALRALLEEVLDRPVCTECSYDPVPRCRFRLPQGDARPSANRGG